jgi:hypothetical protein
LLLPRGEAAHIIFAVFGVTRRVGAQTRRVGAQTRRAGAQTRRAGAQTLTLEKIEKGNQ